jgi:hypothetical protein
MKVFQKMSLVLAVAAFLSLGKGIGFSYAYNPWTTMTGDGVIAVNPFLYAPTLSPFTLGADVVMAYGFTSNIDLFVDFAGLTILSNFSYNYSWGMIRYDLGGNNIIALQASQLAVTPQYHFFFENDIFAAEANAYVSFPYISFGTPTIGAYLAPVYKLIKDTFYLYLEVDPSYAVGSSFALNIAPGFWFGLGSAGQISLSCSLGNVLSGSISPSIGLWYWITFSTKGK